jgi:hypothetical protein
MVKTIQKLCFAVFFLAFTLSILTACSRPGQEVPFTILAEGPVLRQSSPNNTSTQFFIFTNARDVQATMQQQQFLIPQNALNDAINSTFETLLNIDYQQNTGILIVYDANSNDNQDFHISDIRNNEGEITVYLSSLSDDRWYDFLLGGRAENMTRNDPYKVISLPNSHLLSSHNTATFNLILDDSLIDHQEMLMP